MKIALIRREYITHLDGVNRFIALLAEGLKRLGHDVEIFSWCYRGVERERLEEWFREVHGLDIAVPIHTLHKDPCEGDPWARIAFDWLSKGSRILKNKSFDAVVVNGVIPLRFEPKVAVIHDLLPAFTFNKLYVLLGKIILKRYNEIICVSTKTKQELHSTLKLPCRVIPIPVKLDLFKPRSLNERENIVVHIGTRLVKNPQISLEAVKILRKRGYNIRLIIVGSPIQFFKAEEVEYAFNINENEKLELLSKARALILPSKYEGFSYATLEGMACGTPVVVSNAVPEEVLINGFNGIRVNSFNPEDYANALEKLLRDDELWLKLSRNGLEFVKQFDYIEIAMKYANLISELL